MRTLVIGAAAILVLGCASQPPQKPANIDPSNPAAAEAPAPVLTSLVATAETPTPKTTSPAPVGADEHEHGASPAADKPTESAAPSKESEAHAHKSASKHKAKEPVMYTCPMDPEVVSPKPGKCPKCGMKLVPKKADAPPSETQ
jgi:hypothetical protein